jgi:predicted outer membrane repeat protein
MGNADLTLRDCAVAANRAGGHGGGIANALAPGTGNLTLIRTRVSDNFALGVGGGICLTGNDQGRGSTLRLFSSAVLRNTARANAGGIRAETAFLINCTVSANTSSTLGGGIRASTVSLTNSTVSGNKASDGGGIYAENAAILTNSTVSRNTATGAGGGIYTPRTAELTNSTVSGNLAAREGGGMFAFNMRLVNATIARNEAFNGGGVYHFGPDRAVVQNTIIALNRALDRPPAGRDVVGDFISQGHNLIGDGTGSAGFGVNGDQVGTAQKPLDPKLSPLQSNGGPTQTHALLAGSPAIDRGDNAGGPSADQRGVARVRDGDGNRSRITDIGAVER